MDLIGRLSNPEFRGHLAQLQEISRRRGGLGPVNPPARPGRHIPVYEAIASVIAACGGGPMRMCQIHEAVEEFLGRRVPRSTIKMALLTRHFERTGRGMYGLASYAALE
jgi:hypothetical protein